MNSVGCRVLESAGGWGNAPSKNARGRAAAVVLAGKHVDGISTMKREPRNRELQQRALTCGQEKLEVDDVAPGRRPCFRSCPGTLEPLKAGLGVAVHAARTGQPRWLVAPAENKSSVRCEPLNCVQNYWRVWLIQFGESSQVML